MIVWLLLHWLLVLAREPLTVRMGGASQERATRQARTGRNSKELGAEEFRMSACSEFSQCYCRASSCVPKTEFLMRELSQTSVFCKSSRELRKHVCAERSQFGCRAGNCVAKTDFCVQVRSQNRFSAQRCANFANVFALSFRNVAAVRTVVCPKLIFPCGNVPKPRLLQSERVACGRRERLGALKLSMIQVDRLRLSLSSAVAG
jgi:hypothetical protein